MRQLRNFKNDGPKKASKEDQEYVNEAIKKYDGMDEDQLVNALMDSVKKNKAAGTYNPAQMTSFVQNISPYINKEQREKLDNVIRLINGDNE